MRYIVVTIGLGAYAIYLFETRVKSDVVHLILHLVGVH